jgi:sterol desaturase/sphingolipid hydroxylase (fatty acid hydroxylase superfamily)
MTWQIARNVLGHAGVELSPVSGDPSRLFGWLNTTMHHDLHHQNAHFNYGLYFSWWEKLSPNTAKVLAALAFAFFVGAIAAVKGL